MTGALQTIQGLYLLALIAAGMWALYRADEPMVRTFVVILANWIVLATIRDATHNVTPFKAMIVADFITAVIVLLPRVSTPQMFIGEVFFFQMGLHTGMLLTGAPAGAIGAYVFAINALGWLQVALMLIGLNHGTGKRVRLADRNRGHGRGVAHHAGIRVASK